MEPRREISARPALADFGAAAGLSVVVTAGQLSIWAAYALGYIPAIQALTGHFVIIAAIVAWLARAGGDSDRSPHLMLLAATAASGPLGPLVAMLTVKGARMRGDSPELLASWYRRISLATEIDPVSQHCDNVALGRTLDLAAPAPVSFIAVMQHGSLAERQAVLGHIARHFSPQYLPALKLALKSSEPVVRVQAAAVATKARPQMRTIIDRAMSMLAAEPDNSRSKAGDRRRTARDLRALVESGLLDAADATRAQAVATQLWQGALDRAGGLRVDDLLTTARQGHVDDAFEQVLIERGDYLRLRQVRRIAGMRSRGLYSVRRLRGKRPSGQRRRA